MICRCSRDTCDSASVNKNATNLRKIHGRHGHHRRYALKKKHSLSRNFNLKSSLNLRNTRICTKTSFVRTLRDRLRILPTNTLVREASKCMRKIGVPAFHPYLRSLMQLRRCHASPMLGVAIFCLGSYASDVTLMLVPSLAGNNACERPMYQGGLTYVVYPLPYPSPWPWPAGLFPGQSENFHFGMIFWPSKKQQKNNPSKNKVFL